jgi:glucose-6-phosphate 1-dehydrogenase
MTGDNPFVDPLRFERRVPPCVIVIFGANGDLAKRKLLPALYRLAYDRRLPPGFALIGNSRSPMSDGDFRAMMRDAVKQFLEDSPFDESRWNDFAQGIFYVPGDVNDPVLYPNVKSRLAELAQSRQTGNNVCVVLKTRM